MVTSVVTGPNPCGWGNSAGELAWRRDPLAKCGRGGCRDQSTGGRTGNIARMLEPRLPVDVLAALCDAGARVETHERAPPARATNPSTGGHQPKNWFFCQVPLAVTFSTLPVLSCAPFSALSQSWRARYVHGQMLSCSTTCLRSRAISAGLFHSGSRATRFFTCGNSVFPSRRLHPGFCHPAGGRSKCFLGACRFVTRVYVYAAIWCGPIWRQVSLCPADAQYTRIRCTSLQSFAGLPFSWWCEPKLFEEGTLRSSCLFSLSSSFAGRWSLVARASRQLQING